MLVTYNFPKEMNRPHNAERNNQRFFQWHLGFFEKEYTPTYRGFETYYGFWNGKEDYWDHTSQEDVWGTDLRNNMKVEPPSLQPSEDMRKKQRAVENETGHYGTELFTEIAERIIETHNASEPLYLYLAQQGVHSANGHDPLQAPKRLMDVSQNGVCACCSQLISILTISQKVVHFWEQDCKFFVNKDEGLMFSFMKRELYVLSYYSPFRNQGCNYPLKGGKDTFWEGGVRGVGFVHSNLISKKRRVSYDLIDVTDWLPTFYHLAGGDVSAIQEKIDGMNVWDTISHGKKSPRTVVLHNIDPIRKFAAIRINQHKLIVNQDAVYETTWHPRYEVEGVLEDSVKQPTTLPGAVIKCDERLKSNGVSCNTSVFPCLFNIEQDPCEFNNLAFSNLDIVEQLLTKLVEYQKDALPVWFPARDYRANPPQHQGYWGPWMTSKANSLILKQVLDGIPKVAIEKKYQQPSQNAAESGKIAGKVFSTHANHDKDVYEMLKNILHLTNNGRKGHVPQLKSPLTKESLAMLYAKMKEKTKIDKLMHKLQMIKKGRVAKGKRHRSTKHFSKGKIDSSLYRSSKWKGTKNRKVEQSDAKRTQVESLAVDEDDNYNNLMESSSTLANKEQTERNSSLDANSDTEKAQQNYSEYGEQFTSENDGNSNSYYESDDEMSSRSADDTTGTSAKGSGSEQKDYEVIN
ncbi:PREDICTED: arylsulfatase I-like [Acropora digitifera]|uniref:arylsulfatase I-like n=1 Tax=Acropora digitifera TaxID=70779 RepID=UPI00077AE80A|nr:PREDICTED: arylsulfatase I-like [Acropora digitifera]